MVISAALAAVVLPATTATPDRMPVGLDAALDRLPAGTVVFDEYGLGGYLRYRHPDLVPVIDERTELFTVDYVEAYLAARGAKPGWTDFVERTARQGGLVPAESAIADALPRELGWRSLGTSGDYVLPRESREALDDVVDPPVAQRAVRRDARPVRLASGDAQPSGKSRLATTRRSASTSSHPSSRAVPSWCREREARGRSTRPWPTRRPSARRTTWHQRTRRTASWSSVGAAVRLATRRCMVLATMRADVNGVVRRGARRPQVLVRARWTRRSP